ncbi:Topoisomerase 1-associated factor 1 [Steccherinum ochraceum]|uniref:Topoisomerase 1-associated factor 1 n=1 Tax=Steccherinum ochraceum TaxID=92696 RepID=A0A4R0RU22_9APHY|nr:Topoisomerase 1-associated factor 1 [Steccherinum ochraceum]
MNARRADSDVSGDEDAYDSRKSILEPAIGSVVEALGGLESGVYRLGDECYGCLKDLKKYWRKDDTDDERTVARIFWKTRVLPNDLIPILLATAGNGDFEDKRAIACVDLMTAMTWPIDMAEELQELDEVEDKGTDYTELLSSHLAYKATLLKPDVMKALFGIVLSCLAKTSKERTERDVQIVQVVLYLLRNLAFIKDLPTNMYLSSDQAEYSSLQSRFIKLLNETQIFELLLTTASSSLDEPIFNASNTLVLDIFYLLFRGVKPAILADNQEKQPARNLQRLLAAENQRKQAFARNASTRHSRFGTTIVVTLNEKKAQPAAEGEEPQEQTEGQRLLLHRQQAISRDTGSLLDMTASKKTKAQKTKKVDDLGREDNLSVEAKITLQNVAKKFIESCFNPFLESLLKDIRAERPKIAEKDNLRLLYLAKWFLEFFQAQRAQQPTEPLPYGLVAEITNRAWIVWVLRRMREAVEDKPKQWTELQAGIDCLTQLILLIDSMAASDETEMAEAAQTLQHQVIYNGEILDISIDSMRAYKDGTQSLAYLDSSIHLAYALLKMLEKWGKKGGSGEMYVRKKKKKARRKRDTEGMEVPDVEEEEPQQEEEEVIHETMFTFDAFEKRFANSEVAQTLLTYLARYKEFTSPESMKRVVNLLHRQAVKAKAEGLFFNVSTLYLFQKILAEEKSLPRDQTHKDLIALINFLLRKFFKAVEEDSFIAIQAFFPKNRSNWKALSSWEPEPKSTRAERAVEDTRFPPDVQVKKGYTWSQQLGIAIACLVDDGKKELVEWVKEILMMVIGIKQRIIEDTDGSTSKSADVDDPDAMEVGDVDEDELRAKLQRDSPSSDAMAKFTDYLIPYVNDEHAEAACKNPHLKLVFRLVEFFILDEDAEELEWYVPSAILPSGMQRSLNVINQFLETPLDLNGEKAASLLQKKRRRRTRRRRSPSQSGDENAGSDSDAPRRKKKKERKKKEETKYKSAQFIEDSDTDEASMEAFFAREKALREKMALAAASTGKVATMRSTGTKKRKKNAGGKKKRKRGEMGGEFDEGEDEDENPRRAATGAGSDADDADDDDVHFDIFGSSKEKSVEPERAPEPSRPRPKPKPKPRAQKIPSPQPESASPAPEPNGKTPALQDSTTNSFSDDELPMRVDRPTKKKVLVISDDED